MNPVQYKKFVAEAIADPAANIVAVLAELTRLRDKCKKQGDVNIRYKYVLISLLKPTPEFVSGLEQCKNFKELDEFSYSVLSYVKKLKEDSRKLKSAKTKRERKASGTKTI